MAIQDAQKNATLDALRRSCEANEAVVTLLKKHDKRLASIQFWTSCTGFVSLLAIVFGGLALFGTIMAGMAVSAR